MKENEILFDIVIIRHINNICLIEFLKSGWRDIPIKIIETNFNEVKDLIDKKYLKKQKLKDLKWIILMILK